MLSGMNSMPPRHRLREIEIPIQMATLIANTSKECLSDLDGDSTFGVKIHSLSPYHPFRIE